MCKINGLSWERAHATLLMSVSSWQGRLCSRHRRQHRNTCVLFCLLPCACGMRISNSRRWMQLFEEAHVCVLLCEAKRQLEGQKSSLIPETCS